MMMVCNACTNCDGGYVSNAGSTVCTVCEAGTYDDGSNRCADCDDGYISSVGETVCTVCSAGEYDDGSNIGVLTVMMGMFLLQV